VVEIGTKQRTLHMTTDFHLW